jgi:uncharacterized OB-fold protein
VTRIGIKTVGIYQPKFGLEIPVATSIGSRAELRFAAPDEDALTMSWEALNRLGQPLTVKELVLASPMDGLEPRAFSAHLMATGIFSGPTSITTIHPQGELADFLNVASRASEDAVGVLVDRSRNRDPLDSPTGDSSIAISFGESRIAEIAAHVSIPGLTYDRWDEADKGVSRDPRFVEDRLIAHEGKDVLDLLLKESPEGSKETLGVVVTVGAKLKGPRIAQQWGVPNVWISNSAATEPGDGRASELIFALRKLAEAGPGSSLAIINLGWGASGVLLVAGPDIAELTKPLTDIEPAASYNMRTWLHAHRPPYTANPWTSGSELSREAGYLLGLVGSNCNSCSSTIFPATKVCEHCGGFDLSPINLERRGMVITHSIDELYGAPDYSVQMVVVQLNGGGQFYGQAVQGLASWLQIDEPCKLVLRRLHSGSGLPHYFWKVDNDG